MAVFENTEKMYGILGALFNKLVKDPAVGPQFVDHQLRARGSLAIRQSDFGIAPFSILGGALTVQDVLAIEFDLLARRTD